MGKIVCLMGKSSTGKDTIYKKLLAQTEVALKPIVPYTTRPIRAGEQDGVEYHFTDEAGFRALMEQGSVIEHRAYSTCLGLWRYFTVADGSIDLRQASYVMIGTLEAYLHMCRFYGRDSILPVLIELDDGERLQRALNRERAQDDPKYTEMCRRFLADAEDFAEDRVHSAGVERTFRNDESEQCMRDIVAYLREELAGETGEVAQLGH